MLVYLLVYLLVFCPTLRYRSGGKKYVRVYVNPIRVFPFPLETCTTLNISHTHAEMDTGKQAKCDICRIQLFALEEAKDAD